MNNKLLGTCVGTTFLGALMVANPSAGAVFGVSLAAGGMIGLGLMVLGKPERDEEELNLDFRPKRKKIKLVARPPRSRNQASEDAADSETVSTEQQSTSTATPRTISAKQFNRSRTPREPEYRTIGQVSTTKSVSRKPVKTVTARPAASVTTSTADEVEIDRESWNLLPVFIEGLSDEDADKRRQAADGLRELGTMAKRAIGPLRRLLKDPSPVVRNSAASALCTISPVVGNSVRDAVTAVREDHKHWSIDLTIRTLNRVPGASLAAVHEFASLLADEDPAVRQSSAYALGRLGPLAGSALGKLSKALDDSDEEVRLWVIQTIGQIGEAAHEQIPALAGLLKDESREIRHAAIYALGGIGRPAVPTLVKAIRGKDEEVRVQAASALACAGGKHAKTIPALRKALEDPSDNVRTAASTALAWLNR